MPITILHCSTLGETARRQLLALVPGHLQARGDHLRLEHSHALDAAVRDRLRETLGCDVNSLPADFDPRGARLLVTDMDSTLINIECIDEIADFLGLKPQVASITESAMRGEIDFATSLTRRVGLLAGVPLDALEDIYQNRLRLNPGAEALLRGLRERGVKVALVSGGFTFFTERLKQRLSLDYALSNVLEIDSGRLTGRVLGTIVDAQGKADFLRRLCAELGLQPSQAIAVGDGANDLKMMQAAGLSVAYHAKPAVQGQARTAINAGGLDSILALLD